MLTLKLLIMAGIGICLVIFAFFGMRQQEFEAEKRMIKEVKRREIGKIIGRMGLFLYQTGKQAIKKEEEDLKPDVRRDIKKINLDGLGDIEEDSEEDDINQGRAYILLSRLTQIHLKSNQFIIYQNNLTQNSN